jgi:hypothetical protein
MRCLLTNEGLPLDYIGIHGCNQGPFLLLNVGRTHAQELPKEEGEGKWY